MSDTPEGVQIVTFNDLDQQYPDMRPAIIDGLFRSGEVVNVIASPKVGKSHLVGQLAWSIITGRDFVGFKVNRQGSILLVDNELHRETIAQRHRTLCDSMQIDTAYRPELHVMPLRGVLCDVQWLRKHLAAVEPRQYAAIVLDAFYKFLPVGISENDNASMAQVYATLDAIAAEKDTAIICVHHATKGSQADKSVTDVGAGAGSISRAADTHIIIRQHQEDHLAVLEAVTRSFKRPDPISIEMSYPLWTRSDEAPVVRNQAAVNRQQREAEKKQAKTQGDVADVNHLLSMIPNEGIGKTELRNKTGWGTPKYDRLLSQAENVWKVIRLEGSDGRRSWKVYRLHLTVDHALQGSQEIETWKA